MASPALGPLAIKPASKDQPKDDTISYCKIISKTDNRIWDIVHKVISAVLACFFYIFFLSYIKSNKSHIYLTTWGVFITMITRVFALIQYFGKFNDKSIVTQIQCLLQSLNFALEGTIFLFYWAVLAKTDTYITGGNPYRFTISIFNHALCFVLTIIPVALERNDFKQIYFLLGVIAVALIYSIFMVIYRFASGQPIYNVMTFDNVTSWIYLLVAWLLTYIWFYAGFFISRCNERRWQRNHGYPEDLPQFRHCCCILGKKRQNGTREFSSNGGAPLYQASPVSGQDNASSPAVNTQNPQNMVVVVPVPENNT